MLIYTAVPHELQRHILKNIYLSNNFNIIQKEEEIDSEMKKVCPRKDFPICCRPYIWIFRYHVYPANMLLQMLIYNGLGFIVLILHTPRISYLVLSCVLKFFGDKYN